MYNHILIPTNGFGLANKAVEYGVLLAKENGARITAVTVTEPFHLFSVAISQIEYTRSEYKRHADAGAEKALGVVLDTAKRAGVACDTLHIEHEQAIIDAATLKGCDLIVMASHGRHGISAVVLGSETVKVLTIRRYPYLFIAETQPPGGADLGPQCNHVTFG